MSHTPETSAVVVVVVVPEKLSLQKDLELQQFRHEVFF